MQDRQEHTAFSQRLRLALNRAGWQAIGATRLAREFTHRHPNQRVTPHAARKWLLGEAIPTQERLQALARWLAVTPQWLRYGDEGVQDEEGVSTAGMTPGFHQADREEWPRAVSPGMPNQPVVAPGPDRMRFDPAPPRPRPEPADTAVAPPASRHRFMADIDQLSHQQFLLIHALVRELLRSGSQST